MRATNVLVGGLMASTLALGTVGVVVEDAQAASLKTYEATAAEADSYAMFPGGHAFWFYPEIGGAGQRFVFDDNSGTFTLNDDGTARLVGTIESKISEDKKWDVDLLFGPTTIDPVLPKKELKPKAYVDEGGPVDPSTWKFFDLLDSTVTGVGDFEGLNLELTQRPVGGPYAFQLGFGANNKNIDYGFSGWFRWDVTGTDEALAAYDRYGGRRSGTGDINIDIEHIPESSSPLGALGVGLLGFAALSRRKS